MLKKILNYHEEKTHILLKKVCGRYGARVFPKLRVADVFRIDRSGISDKEYSFALKSHFDFIVTDSTNAPQFVVEFDGPQHNEPAQRSRDRIKNQLCNRFGLALLRVNAKYLTDRYRGMDLLTWAIQYWFVSKMLQGCQEQGILPHDEYFDPFMVLSIHGNPREFPMWLSMQPLQEIKRLHDEGRISDPTPSWFVGEDGAGNYHGITFIRITTKSGTYTTSGMRCQSFPIIESELLEEILSFEIKEAVQAVLNGKQDAVPLEVVQEKIEQFQRKYVWSGSSTYGDDPSLKNWITKRS